VTVSCPAASSTSCSVKVALVITEKLSGKKVIAISARKPKITNRKVTLGTTSATVKPGARKQLTVSLNGTGKKLLAGRHTLTVALSVIRKGASTVNRKITFKAARFTPTNPACQTGATTGRSDRPPAALLRSAL
jgi:hypothetical protein